MKGTYKLGGRDSIPHGENENTGSSFPHTGSPSMIARIRRRPWVFSLPPSKTYDNNQRAISDLVISGRRLVLAKGTGLTLMSCSTAKVALVLSFRRSAIFKLQGYLKHMKKGGLVRGKSFLLMKLSIKLMEVCY